MSDGRKNNGGRRPGAGRKRKADELELQALLNDAWPSEKRLAALERVVNVADSDRGDALDALKLLLAYTYGKPVERQEVSGPDGAPLTFREVVLEVPHEPVDSDSDAE